MEPCIGCGGSQWLEQLEVLPDLGLDSWVPHFHGHGPALAAHDHHGTMHLHGPRIQGSRQVKHPVVDEQVLMMTKRTIITK